MKALLISFVVGLLVGVLYGVIRVKSPAPPIVALLGLFGMVIRRASWRMAFYKEDPSFERGFSPHCAVNQHRRCSRCNMQVRPHNEGVSNEFYSTIYSGLFSCSRAWFNARTRDH